MCVRDRGTYYSTYALTYVRLYDRQMAARTQYQESMGPYIEIYLHM